MASKTDYKNMHPYKFSISFRIKHPSRDLSEVYALLGNVEDFGPGRIWRAGDERETPKGRKVEGHYSDSYCYLQLSRESHEQLTSVMERAVEKLSQHRDTLADVVESGGELSFFIGWFTGTHSGEALPYQLLRKLSDLKISLELDIYSEGDPIDKWRNHSANGMVMSSTTKTTTDVGSYRPVLHANLVNGLVILVFPFFLTLPHLVSGLVEHHELIGLAGVLGYGHSGSSSTCWV
jgi:hypothetical protein